MVRFKNHFRKFFSVERSTSYVVPERTSRLSKVLLDDYDLEKEERVWNKSKPSKILLDGRMCAHGHHMVPLGIQKIFLGKYSANTTLEWSMVEILFYFIIEWLK